MTTDPKRLLELDTASFEARLLASALDDSAPARLVDRTLMTVGVAGTGAVVASVTAKTALGAGKAGVLFAGGGLGTAALVGALAGVVAVGATNAGIAYVAGPGPSASAAPAQVRSAPHAPIPSKPEAPRTASVPESVSFVPTTRRFEAPLAEERAEPPDEPRPARVFRPAPEIGQSDIPMGESPVALPSALNLTRETALLDAARSALLVGDTDRGQAALDQYSREFPRGQLADEARSLRGKLTAMRGRTIR